MLGLGWQELIIVVLAIVFICGFFGVGKLGGTGKTSFMEVVDRFIKRPDAGERGSTTL
jgi:Sec-independent protein translocase protein TatA